ncbi:hypothetical protein [Mycobacterium sp. Marseille-P9652]|uniref:hypothetical protein n=1 Tax=Mycobacterium sp. Marseille-P9652 TaxID=2654950 RepID=UPI0012E84E6D|nr:hypothetical protein [Mycobacterium sp. Marseille-P9652]
MAEPLEHFHQGLAEHVGRVVDEHRPGEGGPDGTATCQCGAEGLPDHSRHVAERILDRLAVRPDIDEAKKRIRYASAWFNWELTVLEGAE